MSTVRLRYAFFCFGKALRSQWEKWCKHSPDKQTSKIKTFRALNNAGDSVLYRILFTIDEADLHYVVYTDDVRDSEGNINILASAYEQKGGSIALLPAETDDEKRLIDSILENVNEADNEVFQYTEEEYDDDDDDNDKAMESLGYIIFNKTCDWSDKLHLPVGILPFYILGLILIHSVDAKPTPLWADIGLTVLELTVMRIAYKPYDWFPSVSAYIITLYLYLVWLACLLDRLSPGMKSSYTVTGFWFTRVTAIVTALLGLLWQRHKERKSRNK